MTVMYRVTVIERERGWGPKVDRVMHFTDKDKASAWVKDFNKQSTEQRTPDWYMAAEMDAVDVVGVLIPEGRNYVVEWGGR